jgi:hypothetical protein
MSLPLPQAPPLLLLLLQGLLKGEGKARYGDAWGMWQKQADAFAIDDHAPVRELWYRCAEQQLLLLLLLSFKTACFALLKCPALHVGSSCQNRCRTPVRELWHSCGTPLLLKRSAMRACTSCKKRVGAEPTAAHCCHLLTKAIAHTQLVCSSCGAAVLLPSLSCRASLAWQDNLEHVAEHLFT